MASCAVALLFVIVESILAFSTLGVLVLVCYLIFESEGTHCPLVGNSAGVADCEDLHALGTLLYE